MKTLKITALSILTIGMMACSSSDKSSEEKAPVLEKSTMESYSLDVENSQVIWEGTMLGVYSHDGSLNFIEGSYALEDGKMVSGSFVVDMHSITPLDENYDEEKGKTPAKLVGHLSSDDFFAVEAHPTAKFEVTAAGNGMAKGNLTIRGVTKEETFENVQTAADGSVKGTLTFDRSEYNVSYDTGVTDMVLSNDVELQISLKPAK